MTDLTGIGQNLTFSNALAPKAPYYYISAHLDLSGTVVPSANLTYYFNKDNNLDYLNPLLADSYHNFHTIDANAVIGDVVLFSNPDLNADGIGFQVGGAIFGEDVHAIWGGPTGYTAGEVTADDVNTGVICYYGHEGGHNVEEDPSNGMDHKYLAVTLIDNRGVKRNNKPFARSAEDQPVIVDETLASIRSRKRKQVRSVVTPDIASGTLYVVIKVYPKSQS
jgi:hypothetical protein